jgi:hypothetical protein
MNTGIQDAWNLGWKLALVSRGIAEEGLVDTYDAERRPVGGFIVRFTDRAFSVATSTNPLLRTLRTRLVRGCCPWGCGWTGPWPPASAPSPSSTSATGTARPSRKAAPRCAEGPRPATGSPTPASPGGPGALAG